MQKTCFELFRTYNREHAFKRTLNPVLLNYLRH